MFNLVSINSRRSSKQKIKVPIKYGDTICDLNKKKTGQSEEEIGDVNEVLMNSVDDVNKDDVRAGDNDSCEELGKVKKRHYHHCRKSMALCIRKEGMLSRIGIH